MKIACWWTKVDTSLLSILGFANFLQHLKDNILIIKFPQNYFPTFIFAEIYNIFTTCNINYGRSGLF